MKNHSHKKEIYFALYLSIILIISPVMSAFPEIKNEVNIPDLKQLELKVNKLYEAEANRDWRTWYNLSIFSKQVSYEEFEKEAIRQTKSNVKLLSWSIRNISRKIKPNSEEIYAAVEMDVVSQVPLKKPQKEENQTDYWVYINNNWYFTWRGWPYD